MGLIAGIYSKEQGSVSDLLFMMASKLAHRGNSEFHVLKKANSGWNNFTCKNPSEISDMKMPFGMVGRYLLLDDKKENLPFTGCKDENHLFLDGRIFNISEIIHNLKEHHDEEIKNESVIVHFFEELKKRNFENSKIFEKISNNLEGMFAAALIFKDELFLFRDLIGIKPLYLHYGPKYLAFASEKKALWAVGIHENIQYLPPGNAVKVTKDGFISLYQGMFERKNIKTLHLENYLEGITRLLENNVSSLIPKKAFYLLLSGGIDSSILAAILKSKGIEFNSLVIGSKKSKDINEAREVADFLDINLEVLKIDVSDLEKMISSLIYSLESRDEKKLNIAFPFFYASSYVHKKGSDIIFAGQGADELFGGYERHELAMKEDPIKFQEMMWNDLEELYIQNLQRDDAASMANSIELRLPYLNKGFIEHCMQIPPSCKIRPPIRKYILRQVGGKLGLPEKITQKPKRAMQFSSGSYDILKKLARNHGFTKDFALKNGFFSPTQLFIDSISYVLGFPNIELKIVKFLEKTSINWPDSVFKFKNAVNKTNIFFS